MNAFNCPNCHFELEEGARFCPNCGQEIEETYPETPIRPDQEPNTLSPGVCGRCGTEYDPPVPAFCHACGQPLEGSEDVTPVVEEAQGVIEQSDVSKKTSRRLPTVPKIFTKSAIRPILALLAGIVVVFGGYQIWRFIQGRQGQSARIAACKPVEPGEDFEEANRSDFSGRLKTNAYFAAGIEYSIADNSSLVVPEDITLIVEPGARVRFGQGSKLVIEGTLLACGKSSRRILFTADTANAEPGYWSGVEILNASDESVLGHVTFEFGGGDSHAPLHVEGTDLQLEDLEFDSNIWYAISFDPNTRPRIKSPIEVKNGPKGLEIREGDMTRDQTWGNEQPRIVNGVLTIADGTKLVVAEGSVVRFLPDSALRILGSFDAIGSSDQSILFTSAYDAEEDTRHEPQTGDWGGLLVLGSDSEAHIEHLEIRYAGGISEMNGCVYIAEAKPIIHDIKISNCAVFALSTDIASDPQLQSLTMDDDEMMHRWEIRGSSLGDRTTHQIVPQLDAEGQDLLPVITGQVRIEKDAVLQIESGSTLVFHGKESGLVIEGDIQVRGTSNAPVIMTSWRDDSVGGEGRPVAGDWWAVILKNSKIDSTQLSHLTIRYAGSGTEKTNGCLALENANPTLENLRITDCGVYPISSDAASSPSVSDLDLADNQRANRWEIVSSKLVDNRVFQWDRITDLNGDRIVRIISGQVLVEYEAELELEQGLWLAFRENAALISKGTLRAISTPQDPITLTSWRDNELPSTEGNPQPGDWAGLILEGAGYTKELENVEIRYAGSERHQLGGLTLSASSPRLKNISISHSSYYPITSNLESNPTVEGLDFSENVSEDAWGILGSELPGGSEQQWGMLLDNSGSTINRVVLDDLTIKENALLEIDAGVVVKFLSGTGLHVHGRLSTEGSAELPVVFTSWRDPNYSKERSASAGDWAGIFLNTRSNNTLHHAEVRFAGGGRYSQGSIVLSNASLDVSEVQVREGGGYPISMQLGDNLQLNGLSLIENQQGSVIEIRGTEIQDVGEIVWGPWQTRSGETLPRVITGDLQIGEGTTLRIEPGVVAMFQPNTGIQVWGGFVCSGAVFTQTGDQEFSSIGVALDSTIPWKGIAINGRGLISIEDAVIRNAQNGIWLNDSTPTITNLVISSSHEAAISSDLLSQPNIEALLLSGNAINGMVIRGTGFPAGEARWELLGSVDDQVVRVIQGQLSIGEGSRLTIDPGVIIKFSQQSGLQIDGELRVGRNGAAQVHFTSILDDTVGGSTSAQVGTPNRGGWLGLNVNPNQTHAFLSLLNATIRFARNGLFLTNLPAWDYEGLEITESQFYGISCDAASFIVPDDIDLLLHDNQIETLSCPTPDRGSS